MGQWQNLPKDLLNIIQELVVSYADKLRFTSVCKSWKSALPRMPNPFRQLQLPWLLLPCNETSQSTFGLFNILEKKTYYLDLPKAKQMWFKGSSHGWVVGLEGHDEIYLMNPLTRARIQLPSRSKFPDIAEYCASDRDNEYAMFNYRSGQRFDTNFSSYKVLNHLTDKFFLSSNPILSDDYMVVAIYGESSRLAYFKHGDDRWNFLPTKVACFSDVTFYKGKILALCNNGLLQIVDIYPHFRTQDIAPPYPEVRQPPYRKFSCSEPYLVESSGGLLLVERQVKASSDPKRIYSYETVNFNIFKLDGSKWCRITDIGDDVLFIGFNTSMSRSSLEFPGLKKNSLYFTDNLFCYHYEEIQGGFDIGVFDLNSNSIEPLPGYNCNSYLVSPPPIWVIPAP
ncbi:unnamed protein product [Dovyalis caffra]|uniref:KIB1-4 beta-propeller domain-containing protein n=1 Tax=Dovyalis caffra TaxID=77055 RepID=A0AAV1S7T7_9ROSI|nr:unnamed protein product [Dovyalis caffra]